jgi:AraC-like DNA-binding protein
MGNERRRADRFDVNLQAFIEDIETGEQTEIRFQNLSKSGAYFLTEFHIIPGDWVVIQLGDGLVVTGQVTRSDQLFQNQFGVSIRFAQHTGAETDDEIGVGGVLGDFYQLELREINEEAFSYYPRLNRVRTYVQANLSEPVTLEAAAEVAAMEKTYFSYFFHQKVGITFSVWLQYVRIKQALELLRARNRTITEVAFAVGFNELSTFQKAFKRWTSLTPRDFKKIARPS